MAKYEFSETIGLSLQLIPFLSQSFKQKKEAYNVKSFMNLALDFQKNYHYKCATGTIDKEEKEQKQYWSLVNGNYEGSESKFKTSIEYAADLPVKKHGSGFPINQTRKTKDQHYDYYTNFFNLNNIYRSPTSVLQIVDARKESISGVTSPWVYMGMMFSTFCWHVQDLWLNSINYSHTGATKTWYIVPRSHKQKFDQYVKIKTGRSDLLNRITYMLDPLELISQGIPVHKVNQHPGEYVCTFYKAYHSGFSHGFNVGQAVNFASPISFDYIKHALECYKSCPDRGPSVLPYEWLVYENKVRKNDFAGLTHLVDEEYDEMIKNESKKVSQLTKKYSIKVGAEIAASTKYDRNSCCKCQNYQFLSSLRCLNCSKNYCFEDVTMCCQGKFELLLRQPNEDRRKLLTLCKTK